MTPVAVARGVGGRRGRARRRATMRKFAQWFDPGLGEMSREHTVAELVAGGFLDPNPPPLGYRERRRRAKLRRRARDREVRYQMEAGGFIKKPFCGRGWWAVAEGRRAWL